MNNNFLVISEFSYSIFLREVGVTHLEMDSSFWLIPEGFSVNCVLDFLKIKKEMRLPPWLLEKAKKTQEAL